MKKMLKIFTAFAMISLAISFASCDMDTEDELLNASTEKTSGTGSNVTDNTPASGVVGNDGADDEESTDSGSGSSSGGSSSSTGGDSSGSLEEVTETIGDSWGSLFSNRSHNPIDLQVWQGFDAEFDDDYGMKCEVLPGAWFGGAIVQNCSAAPADSVFYDMSAVTKVTFKVKASRNMAIWAGYSNKAKSDSFEKKNIDVTTEWQTVTLTKKGVKQAWSIFAFGSDGVSDDAWLAFKDITYLDANGKSVTLKYIQ